MLLALRVALQKTDALYNRAFQPASNGFNTSTPNDSKSATLRVTTVKLRCRAVAAIIASSSKVFDFLCINRAHWRKVCASMGSTLYDPETNSSQAPRGAVPRLSQMIRAVCRMD